MFDDMDRDVEKLNKLSVRTKTATQIANDTRWGRGDTRLWRLDPPLADGTAVVVSSAVDLGISIPDYRTSETMIFPWDEAQDRPSDMGELAFVDHKDHEAAIRDLGYEVA
jgi:hypothetical protein